MHSLSPATTLLLAASLLSCDTRSPSETTRDTHADSGTDGAVIVLELDAARVDECDGFCGLITASVGGQPAAGEPWTLESDEVGFLDAAGTLDTHGKTRFCVDGPIRPGTHRIAARVGDHGWDEAPLTVDPFGTSYGLDLSPEPLLDPPWVPAVAGLADDPVLRWAEAGAWDSLSVMMASTVVLGERRLLYYAGTSDVDFQLGVAFRDDESAPLERFPGNPILTAADTGAEPGDWNFFAQNTPEALVVDGEVWLYYNGRSSATGGLSIGLATSTDGLGFTDHPANPVFSPTGVTGDFDANAVAHPSVLARNGVFQLWYASGTLEIGYAVSSDGVRWERYCDNPVFTGSETSWDLGHVKAPEVVFHDRTYYFTYSGCGLGCYEVGWAASGDGIRWAAADAPLLPAQPAPTWNSYGTQAAFIEVQGGTWSFWYTGTGAGHGAIGLASAVRP